LLDGNGCFYATASGQDGFVRFGDFLHRQPGSVNKEAVSFEDYFDVVLKTSNLYFLNFFLTNIFSFPILPLIVHA
jgi:hypothetical protein